MIAWMVATSTAGPRVDVLYDHQWARTTPMSVSSEDTLLDPRQVSLDAGAAVELLFDGPGDDLLLLSFGLRGYDASYRLKPVDFHPKLWERVDRFSGRAELAEEALVWSYAPGSATASLLFGLGWGGDERGPAVQPLPQ